MKLLDLSLSTPEQNLALDEALLEELEENPGQSAILRFWEPKTYFVVLGYSNSVSTEVWLDVCKKDRVPIFRRSSGGGAVLQGPGCLNYALILPIPESGPMAHLVPATQYVMKKNLKALSPLVTQHLQVQGTSDLTLNDVKFSGNAQRRKRRAFLFHGTFLYKFNRAKIEKYLQIPSRQPGYRQGRSHLDFTANISLNPSQIKRALAGVWEAKEILAEIPLEGITRLCRERFQNADWNFKF